MYGLTNEYVENLGKKICGKHFLGTFPCDILPKCRRKEKFSLIINLSKHNTNGSHFIAIFADNNIFLFFDPLGNTCTNKDILNFIHVNRKNRKLKQKFAKIQSENSIFCGYFCLAFLLNFETKKSFKYFFNIFDRKNLDRNDNIVVEFIQNNI
jgi:hypothetical protein